MKRTDLHGYQERTVEHIIKHPFCGVFLDMGLGKTVSTLTAVEALIYDYIEVAKVLVVAPKRVAETVWEEECEKWEHLTHLRCSKIIGDPRKRALAAYADADIYIVSRDNVAWLTRLFGFKLPYDMLVIDELSSFKNNKSKRFNALKKVRPFFKRVVGLTGTPSPNGLVDLWAQIYLLDMGERLMKTVTNYRNFYFLPDKRSGNVVYTYKPRVFAEKEIKDKIADICISMEAKDYIELPERIDNEIWVNLDDDTMQGYKNFKRQRIMELVDTGETLVVPTAVALVNKLLQYANGAIYDEDGTSHEIHDEKLDALDEIVELNGDKPLLVAWSFKSDRDRIIKRFAHLEPRTLETAKDIKDWNDGKIKMLLAHPASAGHGLNLQRGGSIIVWYGLTWSLELYQQFNARLYRQGQTEKVVIHHILARGTADELVAETLAKKEATQDRLLESLKADIERYKKL